MTTKALLRRAQVLFNNPMAPAHVNKHNRKKWTLSVLALGDKWLYAQSRSTAQLAEMVRKVKAVH